MSSTKPRVRAVTTPTRRPVNGPGPTPTATAVRSCRTTPASSMQRAMSGARCSPCFIGCSEECSTTTRSPSWRATETSGVAVSKARSTASRLLSDDPAQRNPAGVELVVDGRVPDGALDDDLEARVGQALGQPGAPLHDGHGRVERRVEVEVVELVEPAEPVGVDVHEVGTLAQGGVHAGD